MKKTMTITAVLLAGMIAQASTYKCMVQGEDSGKGFATVSADATTKYEDRILGKFNGSEASLVDQDGRISLLLLNRQDQSMVTISALSGEFSYSAGDISISCLKAK